MDLLDEKQGVELFRKISTLQNYDFSQLSTRELPISFLLFTAQLLFLQFRYWCVMRQHAGLLQDVVSRCRAKRKHQSFEKEKLDLPSVCIVLHIMIIPHICQFWYATTLFRPLKVHQKAFAFEILAMFFFKLSFLL